MTQNIFASGTSFLRKMEAGSSATDLDTSAYQGFSSEVLLQYIQSQLGDIDRQIDKQFNQQKSMQAATSSVNDAQALFAQNPSGLTMAQANDAVTKLTAAAEALPDGDPQKTAINSEIDKLNGSINFPANANNPDPNHKVIDPKDVQPYSDALGSISKDIGNESTMQMMTLQSLIQKRETAITSCTSMIQSDGESLKTIASKIS